MKIACISSTVFKLPITNYGGLEALAWSRAAGLAARGHSVLLLAPDGSTCPGCEVVEFGPPGGISEKDAYAKYWQRLADVEVVIDDSWQKWAYIGKAEGWLKTPVLGVMHAPVNTMISSMPPGVEKPCFVCISEDQKNHFEALFGREARAAYNGVCSEFYRPLSIPRGDRFLFLARFSTIKSPDLAITACLNVGVGLDLVGDTTITGEPEYLEKCKRLAEQTSPGWDRNKGKQIRIYGGVSRGETVWWFSQARALIHCTPNFREPFGLSPVESMLCESPVLAWRYGAVKETVKDGVSGYLVSSQAEMEDVLRSGKLEVLDRAKCREHAKQFSMDRFVARYEELCQEAIETGGW